MQQTPDPPAIVQPFTYTGREWDAAPGLYYYRNRYYDPSFGRFLSEDPSDIQPDLVALPSNLYRGISLFVYADNNPIVYFDPFGDTAQRKEEGVGPEACKYYDDVAKKHGCKYHGGSGRRYCRNPRTNPCITFVSTTTINLVRKCLIEEDKKAINDPKSQSCKKPPCPKRSVIVNYHKRCFNQNGIPGSCFPSWYPFTNDGE